MKRFCTPLLLFLFLTSPADAMMSSTNYTITSMVLSGGGGAISSTSYRLTSTIGQSSPSGTISSTGFAIDSGFWHTLLLLMVGDINGDGVVNLEDAISALQVITGQSPTLIVKEADMDGDGVIGIIEALKLLRRLGAVE